MIELLKIFSEVDGELTFEDNLHENWKENISSSARP